MIEKGDNIVKNQKPVLIIALILSLFIVVGGIASGQDVYVVKEDEKLFGTWVNTDYDGRGKYAKIIMKFKNTWDEYYCGFLTLMDLDATSHFGVSTMQINGQWEPVISYNAASNYPFYFSKIPQKLSSPTLYSPEQYSTTNDNTPLFDWSSIADATKYHLQVQQDTTNIKFMIEID